MKRFFSVLTTLFLTMIMAISFACCSSTTETDENVINAVSMSKNEAYLLVDNIYDSPSSYIGKTIIIRGEYEKSNLSTFNEEKELLVVCHYDPKTENELEQPIIFQMKDNAEHIMIVEYHQDIEVKGLICVVYDDQTTSLDYPANNPPQNKKILYPFILAEYMAIF